MLRICGADCKLEMGTLAEIVYRQDAPLAILFEDIPGYPKGSMRARLVFNAIVQQYFIPACNLVRK